MKKLVITGLGVISPIGNSVEEFKKNLFNGVCGIEKINFPFKGQDFVFPGAPVKNFNVAEHMDEKKAALLDRFSQFAVASAIQAYKDSGLELTEEEMLRTGVISGTGVGGQNTLEESYMKLLGESKTVRVHPFTIPKLMVNAGSSQICMALGITGASFTVASACASAIHAMGTAAAFLRAGIFDRVITGGSEACLTFGTLKGWEALRVMAPDVCRPFSKDRLGMVLGEGACSLVMETEESAKKRNARIYAEFAGFGMSSDAKDLTTPDVNGAARAIENCLKDAQINSTDIDYVNAHGTGTRINDITETEALKKSLGNHAYKIAVSSSKSMFGHALGAAGALEMLATVLAVCNDKAPPTINYIDKDTECDLDYVPNVARDMKIDTALNNSFAFGGLNASIAVRKYR
ncbi:MAG: beta-ketoacyl-[acyl-carrier-protein] synthase family protein [Alphaproteobacteria bacterium]|nr:beta-ketoacyl-[acyl-carrier-protein] synthase family protein [Alphaproteobacteria bacterium]MCL2505475.1 beta-ketoacyl-[acyl-carrier-protein] synthase family protein [Alphaproteobacteria bacterium]